MIEVVQRTSAASTCHPNDLWTSSESKCLRKLPLTSDKSRLSSYSLARILTVLLHLYKYTCIAMAPKAKQRSAALQYPVSVKLTLRRILVKLVSTALSGFFYTTSRPRLADKLAMMKYDPKGGCLETIFPFRSPAYDQHVVYRLTERGKKWTRLTRSEKACPLHRAKDKMISTSMPGISPVSHSDPHFSTNLHTPCTTTHHTMHWPYPSDCLCWPAPDDQDQPALRDPNPSRLAQVDHFD